MKMFAYRGKADNFGDELNHWMWSRLLPDFFDGDERELFLGIGSILYDTHPTTSKKIVFGAGYAGYSSPPEIDDSWEIYFVRGKRTAEVLKLPPEKALGDSGILIRAVDLPTYSKRHDVSFMPHFETASYGSWEPICRALGINFIDPRWNVDTVLEHLLSSRLVISEAMHGVIIADALRIPWQAIRPLDPNHRAKWQDWASMLDVQIDFADLPPSNLLQWTMARFWNRRRVVYQLRKRRDQLFPVAGMPLRSARIALAQAAKSSGQLSSDAAIANVTAGMLAQLDALRRNHGKAS